MLDFGTAGLGDPAVDIACLFYVFGESFIAPLMPNLQDDEVLLNRARFWAATLDLQVTLGGLKRSDKKLLVAHLGSAARDLMPTGSRAGNGRH